MTTRRVLGAGSALLGAVGLVVALAGVIRGDLAVAPFGVLGLLLLGVGLAMARTPAPPPVPPLIGAPRIEPSAGGPTGIFGFGLPDGGRGGDGGGGGPGDGGPSPSAGGGSGGDTGWSGGGWSGGGDGGGSGGGGN
ncbi:hypothetical protein V6U81_07240 [Micromonospora sp. CPCC 205711]|uniref:hypothetical protein n=1 Tax=Micromonospora sp. CPCC 205547 TaxID=3122400 RepID=UPI002FF2B582